MTAPETVDVAGISAMFRRAAAGYRHDDTVWILLQRIATDTEALEALLWRRANEAAPGAVKQ